MTPIVDELVREAITARVHAARKQALLDVRDLLTQHVEAMLTDQPKYTYLQIVQWIDKELRNL